MFQTITADVPFQVFLQAVHLAIEALVLRRMPSPERARTVNGDQSDASEVARIATLTIREIEDTERTPLLSLSDALVRKYAVDLGQLARQRSERELPFDAALAEESLDALRQRSGF